MSLLSAVFTAGTLLASRFAAVSLWGAEMASKHCPVCDKVKEEFDRVVPEIVARAEEVIHEVFEEVREEVLEILPVIAKKLTETAKIVIREVVHAFLFVALDNLRKHFTRSST